MEVEGRTSEEPGQVSGASTQERLLDAAERLFGERGYEGTSLRAVAKEAGANIAAVNYHFRSKEGLLKAVVARAMDPVNTQRAQRLTALHAEGGEPSVGQVVRAFVEPGLALAERHGSRGAQVARFLAAVLLDPSPKIRQLFADQVDPVEGRYLDALRRALPHQETQAIVYGYTYMLGLLALHQARTFAGIRLGAALPPREVGKEFPVEAQREHLITFLTAGLTAGAPVSSTTRPPKSGSASPRAASRDNGPASQLEPSHDG